MLARFALLLGAIVLCACGVGRLGASADRDVHVNDASTPPAPLDDTRTPPAPLNDTDAQLAAFWKTYGDKETAPQAYVIVLDAFLRAEDDIERGDFAGARARIDRVFSEYPLSTLEWGKGGGWKGTNVGSPVAYYGMRMLDEIVSRAEVASARQSRPIQMTVVMPKCAQGMRPTTADLSTGEQVNLTLHASISQDDHRIVRQSLRVFQHYVWAISDGALRLEPKFVHVDECVAVMFDRPSYAGIEDSAKAIAQVSEDVAASTDMWWVLYPSNVPDGAQFGNMDFLSGGVGEYAGRILFISDDLWLVRKPAHLGQGAYTDVERRAYLPQWLQHEFFHRLFGAWPELELEAKSHQWLDRRTWPSDFVGQWEPDYYAEALRKRLSQAQPSIATKLQIASPPSLVHSLTLQDFVGSYERPHVENDWHRVTLAVEDGRLIWRNAAGTQWDLTWSDGALKTVATAPHGEQTLTIELQRNASNEYMAQIRALRYRGETFLRL